MLQLQITYELSAQGVLQLTDATPAYDAVAAPGGYGGPNPARATVQLVALIGQQQPGTYRFSATAYPLPGRPLAFQLLDDALYEAYVFAVPVFSGASLPSLAAGQIRATLAGMLIYGDAQGVNRELVLAQYGFEQLRSFSPALIVTADYILQLAVVTKLQNAVDKALLEYTRQASRNRPQGGEDYAKRWVQAQATLQSITTLTAQGRYPEAASQIAGLQQLLGTSLIPALGMAPRNTDWISEQTA